MSSKLKCVIVDDEQAAHYVLENYIERVNHLELVASCFNIQECLGAMRSQHIDIIFLDINIPEVSGLEFLETISPLPKVILTTAHSEYALLSYEFGVVDYLLKPFPFTRFLKAINKISVLSAVQPKISAPISIPESHYDHILVKVNGEYKSIFFDQLIYIQSWGNYVKLITAKDTTLSAVTTIEIEKKLPRNRFLRIHKSYIVDINKITAIKGNSIYLKDDIELPIGITYRRELIDRLK